MPRTRSLAWSELKLGIVGVVAVVAAGMLIVAIGGKGGFPWQKYPLKAKFKDIQGMKAGAVVRVSGKEVGAVTSVEFSGAEIEVVVHISHSVRSLITDQSRARIGTLSLLGEPIIDITAAQAGTPLANNAYITSVETKGMMGDLAESATKSLDDAGKLIADMRAGRGTVGKLFTDEALYTELTKLTTSSAAVVDALQNGQGTIGALMKDDAAYKSLRTSLDDLQTMTTQIRRGDGALGRLVNDPVLSQSLSASTASVERASANLDHMTDNLNKGQGTMGKLLTDQQMYDQVNSVAGKLNLIAAGLDEGKGTAGQLLRDKQLYDNMNKAVSELTSLLADIRKDPKKFLRVQVSIF